jgi:hypothetical protein
MKNIKKLFFALTAILCLQQPCHAGFMDTLSSYGSSAFQWIQQNPRITGLFATIFTAQAVYSYRQHTTIKNLKNQIPTLEKTISNLNGELLAANEELDEFKALEREIEGYWAEKAKEAAYNRDNHWAGDFFLTDEERSAQDKKEERQQRINEAWDSRRRRTLDEEFKEQYRKFTDKLPANVKGFAPALPW